VQLLIAAVTLTAHAANLDTVLDRTSRQVSEFLEQVSDVKCTERVSQVKLNRGGRAEYSGNSTYDYFVLIQGSQDDLLLNESRLQDKDDKKPGKNIPLLITNGFSTMFLVFHPYYRNGFRFEIQGDEVVAGRRLVRVHFTHVLGMRTPAALAVRGREYPLELTGTAVIDPETGEITRIDTTLANDMSDVGLRSLSAEVDYAPVRLPGWNRAYLFPVLATIDVETLRQHWRNVHRFTAYKRFMVDTEQSVSEKPVTK
jgi:hypothetical protein